MTEITADNKIILMFTQLMLQTIQNYLGQIDNISIITNNLLLQIEALSDCGNFIVITILQ